MMIQWQLPQSGGLWLWELSYWGFPLVLLVPLVVSELVVVRGKGGGKRKDKPPETLLSSLSSSSTDPPTAAKKFPLRTLPPSLNTRLSLLVISPWGLHFNICLLQVRHRTCLSYTLNCGILIFYHLLNILLLTSGSLLLIPWLHTSRDKMARKSNFLLVHYFHYPPISPLLLLIRKQQYQNNSYTWKFQKGKRMRKNCSIILSSTVGQT